MTEAQTPYTITRNGALVDGDDMTWQTQDGDLNMWEIAKQVRDLRNAVYGLQSEIVDVKKENARMKERLEAWEADS